MSDKSYVAIHAKRSHNHMSSNYVYSGHMIKQRIPLGVGSRQYKKKAIKAAIDLGYPKEVIEAIESTDDYEKIASIMEHAGEKYLKGA